MISFELRIFEEKDEEEERKRGGGEGGQFDVGQTFFDLTRFYVSISLCLNSSNLELELQENGIKEISYGHHAHCHRRYPIT